MSDHIEFKVFRKLLATESRFNRAEELKLKKRARRARERGSNHAAFSLDRIREEVYKDRTHYVRKEARSANLAFGYLSGRSYLEVENSTKTFHEEMMKISEEVLGLLLHFSSLDVTLQDVQDWMLLEEDEEEEDSWKGTESYFENAFDLSWLTVR